MQAATRAASTVAEDTERALADRVRDALAVLDQRPDGHLPRPYRRAIQVLIAAEPDGRRRLVDLDRRCAARVLPRWHDERPGDKRPERMLALAGAVAAGEMDSSATEREHDRFDVDVLDSIERISDRARAAGLAAAPTDFYAHPHDAPEAIPEDQDDWDVDACGWDTAYLASQAEASWPGAQDDDPEARRAFRRWYLEEALPATLREP